MEKNYQKNIEIIKYFNNCRECYIEPDWLLVYKYNNDELILYLIGTGSHTETLKI